MWCPSAASAASYRATLAKELVSLQAMAVEDRLALLLRIVAAGLDEVSGCGSVAEAVGNLLPSGPARACIRVMCRECALTRRLGVHWPKLGSAAEVRSLSIKRLVPTTVLPSPSPKIGVAVRSAVSRFPAPIRFERNWVVIAGLTLRVIFMLNLAWNRNIWSVQIPNMSPRVFLPCYLF